MSEERCGRNYRFVDSLIDKEEKRMRKLFRLVPKVLAAVLSVLAVVAYAQWENCLCDQETNEATCQYAGCPSISIWTTCDICNAGCTGTCPYACTGSFPSMLYMYDFIGCQDLCFTECPDWPGHLVPCEQDGEEETVIGYIPGGNCQCIEGLCQFEPDPEYMVFDLQDLCGCAECCCMVIC